LEHNSLWKQIYDMLITANVQAFIDLC